MNSELETLVSRLEDIGQAQNRFADVENGHKESYSAHDDPQSRIGPSEICGNYGVYGGNGLIIVDIDDHKDDVSLPEEYDDLPDTFSVRSPHDGEHRYYNLEADIADLIEKEWGSRNLSPLWGEIRVEHQYVVGPGSELDSCGKDDHDCSEDDEGYYTIQQDRAIASLPTETLLDTLNGDPDIKNSNSAPSENSDPRPNSGGTNKNTVKYAREVDGRFDDLWEWAYKNENPEMVGFSDRSSAEVALAAKLWFWLCEEELVRKAMNRANPPKWSQRGEKYKKSVLNTGDNNDYRDFRPNSGGGGICRETFLDVLDALILNEGQARIGEIVSQERVSVDERQAQNALSEMQDLGYVENKQIGIHKYWVGDLDELFKFTGLEKEYINNLTTYDEWESQRRDHFRYN